MSQNRAVAAADAAAANTAAATIWLYVRARDDAQSMCAGDVFIATDFAMGFALS